jgi:predicted RNase H-like HicB family nuclease
MGDHYVHSATGLQVVVREDPSGGYYALVPALPGCGSQGESHTELFQNVDEAIMAVLEVIQHDEPDRYQMLMLEGVISGEGAFEVDSTDDDVIWTDNVAAAL